MRKKHLQQRWGSLEQTGWVFATDDPASSVTETRAPLGDFLREYILHLSLPWWRRIGWTAEWKSVELSMRKFLNDHSEVVWIEKS
jgi:hypothetical protein